ncbi:MAG: cobalt-precorrin-5B (C(1))-methyltransferase, partial [Alphaproteobacteria bacterium]|nr:cobalt-precorrin-5B (C(1))-methyltransferase [Alphaproteobacteria bacterium]
VPLPRGLRPVFALCRAERFDGGGRAGVIKDAGDDPDVTHGLEIVAEVRAAPPGGGVRFQAGEGVGTVTLPGRARAPGEPAINPGPRAQITAALEDAAGGPVDVTVTLSIPGGAAVAAKTHNPRLGIRGGLSVLGTTGVVVPYSCASWIHAIQRGVDVARAGGHDHILASTGRTSEQAANADLELADEALIDMGDFAGGLLKYLRRHPVGRLTIAGGFAKMVKLGQGAMDLHSARSHVDFARLADLARDVGGGETLVQQARYANTAAQVLDLAGPLAPDLARAVARRARETAMATLAGGTDVRVCVYDRQGQLRGTSS